MADLATLVSSVHVARPRSVPTITALDILLAAATSPSGWVRLSAHTIISPRQIQKLGLDSTNNGLERAAHLLDAGAVVEKTDWISVPSVSEVEEVREWIREMRRGERGRTFLRRGTVLGIVDPEGGVSGVVEIEEVLGEGELEG